MNMKRLKAHLTEHFGLPADATEEDAKALTVKLLESGGLHHEKYVELLTWTHTEKRAELLRIRDTADEQLLEMDGRPSPAAAAAGVTLRVPDALEIDRAVADAIAKHVKPNTKGAAMPNVNPESVITDGARARGHGAHIEGREPSERYSNQKYVGKHFKSGLPVLNEKGREAMLPSEREFAKAGAFFKHRAARSGLSVVLSDHEKSLVEECFASDLWCGSIGGAWEAGIEGHRVKALLNDGTSGGQEVVPEWFDDAIVTFPLLSGELLPYVDLRQVPRGAAVEGASIGNPTVTWGTNAGDGGSLSLFTTTSLVEELNTTIHPVAVAVEIGRDFLSDAAVDVGRILMGNIGERFKSELDRVIAVGQSGSGEPTGLFNSSGTTIVVNGSPSPTGWDVTDVENLVMSLPKQYRDRSNPSVRFVSNDTTYFRVRGLPVSTTDQRRIFGLSHEDYRVMDRGWSVQNDIGNANAGFVDLKKYRLYRRLGMETRFSDQGQTLMLKNTSILLVRARFGGRLMDGAAMAEMNSAPS